MALSFISATVATNYHLKLSIHSARKMYREIWQSGVRLHQRTEKPHMYAIDLIE